jgi:prolyl 4-hydroxylase
MKTLPEAWKKWLISNLLNGVDAEKLLDTLLENGFNYEVCKKALGTNLPADMSYQKDATFYHQLAHPLLLKRLDESGARYLEQDKAQLLRLDSFLSPSECAEITRIAKTKLRPSTITVSKGYEGFRTSTTCDLPYLNEPAADSLDRKVINCLGLGVGENEVIQAQHYDIGQQFKAHTDYFEPGAEEYKQHAKTRGQRTWTFMVYLNEECDGGETEFCRLGLKVRPKTGTALIWNNLYADGCPNPDTIHQSHPITAGEKMVITKWFRDQQQ